MRPQPPQCSPTGLQTASVWDTNLPHVPLQKGAKGELRSCQQGLLLTGAAELLQHPEGAAPKVSSIFWQLAFMLCVLLAHRSVCGLGMLTRRPWSQSLPRWHQHRILGAVVEGGLL